MTTLDEELKHPLNNRMFTCPVQGKWTSFQLVDEFGEGAPYAGLPYKIIDTEGYTYTGKLDGTGKGKVDNHFAGPIALTLEDKYQGNNGFYAYLQQRLHCPLPIIELQVRAEQTRYYHKDGSRTQSNPAQACADFFCQVEVRHFVEHVIPPPEQLEFLLAQSLKEADGTLAERWQAHPEETPTAHFQRIYQTAQFWQGDAS
ncbi:hypothetical protein [Pseudomonas chlororaphis]|uniref:hypothetical protein n=1 Tax=Pseudomonas chlororaphis TaxID=587753 RepID=UPI003082898B